MNAPANSLRKHLFADLQPYVCPWDQCLGNTTTFRSRDTWINHLDQEHTIASHWNGLTCPLCLESAGDGLGAVSVHIARHLEDVALAAIPRNVDSELEAIYPCELPAGGVPLSDNHFRQKFPDIQTLQNAVGIATPVQERQRHTSRVRFPFGREPPPHTLDNGSDSEGDTSTSAETISLGDPATSGHQQRRPEHIIQDTGPSVPKEPHDLVNRLSRSRENQVTFSSRPIQPIGVTKAPYIRPSSTRVNCPDCKECPDGFRGEHELNRHWQRAHARVRTVWVTVDASSDKEFLAKCKQCRAGKKYDAYYNAAAHLRRAHFRPPKRGRKPKGGNKGRSDLPTVDDLMRGGWIKEITEVFDNDDVNDNKHDLASSELEDIAKLLPTSILPEAPYSPPTLHSSFLEDEKSEYELVTERIE